MIGVRDASGHLDIILSVAVAISLIAALFMPEKYTNIARVLIVIALILVLIVIKSPRKRTIPPIPRTWTTDITMPCLPGDLDRAIGIAQWYFGEDRIPTKVVQFAHKRCPYSVIVAKNTHGDVIGYVDLFLIKAAVLEDIVAGRQREENLTEEDFVGIEAARTEKAIYVGSIAVDERLGSRHFDRSKVVHQLIHAVVKLCVQKIMDTNDNWQICAIGNDGPGRSLLAGRLGFGERAPRRYWREINRREMRRYLRNSPVAPAEANIRID